MSIPLIEFGQLKKKYKQISPKKYTFLPLYPTPELAELIGMLLTEGTINKSGSINFVNTDEHLISRYQFLLKNLFRRKKIMIKEVKGFKHKKSCVVARITSTAVLKTLKEIDLPIGRRSTKDFEVPRFIRTPEFYNLTEEGGRKIQQIFIKTIFDCDGSRPFKILDGRNYKIWIRYEMTKHEGFIESGERFLIQIKEILKKFDIDTTRIYRYKDRLFFNITRKAALLNFYKYIGYSIAYKQKELENLHDFIINFETITQKKRKKILESLYKPRTTQGIKNIIGLHFSKTYDHLIYLENKGLIIRIKGIPIRNGRYFTGSLPSVWFRR